MAQSFERGKSDAARAIEAEIERPRSKIGQLVVERISASDSVNQIPNQFG